MSMLPVSFSIKGFASITFKDKKEQMKSGTIWDAIKKILKYYPTEIKLLSAQVRGSEETTENEDPLTRSAIMDMVQGCIETCNIKESIGLSVNLLLGDCYEYRIPFGISSDDTGHQSIILTLPFPMSGCYMLRGNLDGSIRKSKSAKEYYMVSMNLEIYIGSMTDAQYSQSLSKGIRVYPFKIEHPEYYPKNISSDSEYTTEPSDEDEPDEVIEASLKKMSMPSVKSNIRKRKNVARANMKVFTSIIAKHRKGLGTPDNSLASASAAIKEKLSEGQQSTEEPDK